MQLTSCSALLYTLLSNPFFSGTFFLNRSRLQVQILSEKIAVSCVRNTCTKDALVFNFLRLAGAARVAKLKHSVEDFSSSLSAEVEATSSLLGFRN